MENSATSGLPLARYNVCTNARCICKGSYGKESLKMELTLSRSGELRHGTCHFYTIYAGVSIISSV